MLESFLEKEGVSSKLLFEKQLQDAGFSSSTKPDEVAEEAVVPVAKQSLHGPLRPDSPPVADSSNSKTVNVANFRGPLFNRFETAATNGALDAGAHFRRNVDTGIVQLHGNHLDGSQPGSAMHSYF